MVSSTETTASTSAAGVTPPSHLPPGMPAIEPMDTLLAPTMENLLATAGIGPGRKPRTLPRMPAALVSARRDLICLNSRHLLPEGRKQHKQCLIDNRCSHLNVLHPNRAPPPVPARITGTWPERQKVPEEGPHPEGLKTGNEGADPPPEDPRSTDGVPQATV